MRLLVSGAQAVGLWRRSHSTQVSHLTEQQEAHMLLAIENADC